MCSKKKKKGNGINVKVFNMTTNKSQAKTMAKHIPCDYKWKFNSTTRNSNKKWNNETCQCQCKGYRTCKQDYSWNPNTYFCENSKYLKSIADTLVNRKYICYGYCINKNNEYYSNKCVNKLS